jgi:hypothetical protein
MITKPALSTQGEYPLWRQYPGALSFETLGEVATEGYNPTLGTSVAVILSIGLGTLIAAVVHQRFLFIERR